MKKIILFVVVVAAVSGIIVAMQRKSQSFGELIYVDSSFAAEGRVDCGPANTVTIMGANPSRLYAAFIVASSTAVSICPGTTCTAQEGIFLNASGGSWEIDSKNLYRGAITCRATATSSVAFVQY